LYGPCRCVTDDEGRFRFITIQASRTRGATISTHGTRRTSTSSCFVAHSRSGFVTQMYFPGEPADEVRPHLHRDFTAIHDERAQQRMVSRFSIEGSAANWALAYEFGTRSIPDAQSPHIYARGADRTPLSPEPTLHKV